MDKQNNLGVDNKKQPLQDPPLQTPLNHVENIKKVESKLPKFFIPALIGVLIVILAIGGVFFLKNNRSSNNVSLTNTQQSTVPTSSEQTGQTQTTLDTLFASLNSTYNGNIPWANINNRNAYKFYPKEVNGLPVANGEVSISHDNNYNPLTVFKMTETVSIPLKNAYISYFEVPDVLRKKFNLGDMDIVMPLELKVYEFDRKLSDNESSIIAKGENFRCTNEKSKAETASFSNPQLVMYYCNVNLTEEQKTQVKDKGFFDKIYEIYFVDRNVLIQFSADSAYISNPQEYLSDYMTKLFNSNDTFFVTQNQIKSVEDSRKFEEWRSKTFDNQ